MVNLPVKPATAEGEGAEVLVDGVEQGLGLLQPQRDVAHVEVLHVMGTLHVLVHVALARAAERLDGVELVLLHDGSLAALDDGHGLAGVDLVGRDGVTVEVPDALHLVGHSLQLDLVGLHHLLNGRPNVTQPRVNAGSLDPDLRGLLHALQQRVVLRVEGQGPGTVDNTTLKTEG